MILTAKTPRRREEELKRKDCKAHKEAKAKLEFDLCALCDLCAL
jgi:hypothetical protein